MITDGGVRAKLATLVREQIAGWEAGLALALQREAACAQKLERESATVGQIKDELRVLLATLRELT